MIMVQMTKNLLILSLFILSGIQGWAQCTPDVTLTKPGFYPEALPAAVVNVNYNQVLQFKILKDTTVVFNGVEIQATVDSATIMKVDGMPDGLTFKLNKVSQTYTPAEVGCALISGVPTKKGTFYLDIIILLYAKVARFPIAQVDTLQDFEIVVKGSAGIEDLTTIIGSAYPNPLKGDYLQVSKEVILSGSKFTVSNGLGQRLHTTTLVGNEETLPFPYPAGLYFLSFDNGTEVYRIKVLKQ